MTGQERREITTRLKSFELRLRALRNTPGPTDPKDAEAERFMQSAVNRMREQLQQETR